MTSGYAVTAQYYDAVTGGTRTAINAGIAAALRGLETDGAPVLDIGAGTGLTTAIIAQAVPDAEIFAIEPDPSMRAALMTRVCADADLRRRVTILPRTFIDAVLPDAICGAVLSASLVHFSPQERANLWTTLADRLTPAGRIVVEIQCPQACDIDTALVESASIGRYQIEAWATATAIGKDQQLWRMEYRTLLNGDQVAHDATEYACWTVSADTVANEAAKTELIADTAGDLLILTKAV